MTSIDLDRARQMLCWSALAYLDGLDAIAASPYFSGSRAELSSIQQFTLGIDSVIVGTTLDGLNVVAFRGTVRNNLRDWLNDSDCLLAPSDSFEGSVHLGFEDSVLHLWDKTEFGTTARRLPMIDYITGHSKGAGIAILFAEMLVKGAPELFTFGCPMTGDSRFAEAFNAHHRMLRFEHRDDIVPHLPGQFPLLRLSLIHPVGEFVPVGQMCFLDWSGQLRTTADPMLSGLRLQKLLLAGDEAITDHFVEAYMEAIDAVMGVSR